MAITHRLGSARHLDLDSAAKAGADVSSLNVVLLKSR